MTSAIRPATTETIRPATTETRTGTLDEMRSSLRRVVGGARSFDVPQALLRVGIIATPTGLLAIVLGYWGAAHAARPIEQTPYLISGGVLGLALVFVGSFAYFAHWLTRSIDQQERVLRAIEEQSRSLDERLASIADRLGDAVASRPVVLTGPTSALQEGTLLVTPTGALAHRPDCPVVANRDDARLAPADTELGRCKICRPALAPA